MENIFLYWDTLKCITC